MQGAGFFELLWFKRISHLKKWDIVRFLNCSELYAIIGFYQTKVSDFGNSVPKIFTLLYIQFMLPVSLVPCTT